MRHSCVVPYAYPGQGDNSGSFHDGDKIRYSQERSLTGRYAGVDGANTPYRKHAFYSSGAGYSQNVGEIKIPSAQEVEREFAILWRHLQKSAPFCKYRSGQRKKDNKEQPWTEATEVAFWRAVVKFKPMGRLQIIYPPISKLRGRNELVAYEIEQETGEERGRKKVSSHIQVLKNYLKHDHFVMRYLCSTSDKHRRRHHQMMNSVPSRRPSSNHFVAHPSRHNPGFDEVPKLTWNACSSVPSMSPDYASPWAVKRPEPVDFKMFARIKKEKGIDTKSPTYLHAYTKFAQQPKLNDLHPLEMQYWNELLPESCYMLPNSRPDWETILCEASLEIKTDLALGRGAELAVQLEIAYEPDYEKYDYHECRTTFHSSGVVHDGGTKPFNFDVNTVPFGSEFWARKLLRMTRVMKMKHEERPQERSGQEGAPANATEIILGCPLDQLSAVQEIFAHQKDGMGVKRLLVIFWRFCLAPAGETGKATWRYVVPPVDAGVHLQAGYESQRQPLIPVGMDLTSLNLPTSGNEPMHAAEPFTQVTNMHGPFSLDNVPDMSLSLMGMRGHLSANDHPHDLHPHDNDQIIDFTQHHTSLPSGHHPPDPNAIDFTGGHIAICFGNHDGTGVSKHANDAGSSLYSTTCTTLESPSHAAVSPTLSFDESGGSGDSGGADGSYPGAAFAAEHGGALHVFHPPRPHGHPHPPSEWYGEVFAVEGAAGGVVHVVGQDEGAGGEDVATAAGGFDLGKVGPVGGMSGFGDGFEALVGR